MNSGCYRLHGFLVSSWAGHVSYLPVVIFVVVVDPGSYYVAKAGLELVGSSDPLVLAFPSSWDFGGMPLA